MRDAERHRGIFGLTYEHARVNAAFDYLWASDQTRTVNPKLDSNGFSMWVTPKTTKGWEGLLRFDHLEREQSTATAKGKTDRTIAGVSYWFPHQGNVSTAILLDYDGQSFNNITTAPVHAVTLHGLINF